MGRLQIEAAASEGGPSAREALLRRRVIQQLQTVRAWIFLGALALFLVGVGWGLPASDGWDNDGIAPRDFLVGVIQTFTPGEYFTYPPAHLLLLTVVTSPVTLTALAKAPSLAPADVVGEMIQVPYMTAIALIARLVSVAMALGTIVALGKMARIVSGKRAESFTMAAAAVNAVLAYYAKTTNLDVPYLFWSTLSLLALTEAVAEHKLERLRRFAVFAAIAIATKDQAYAVFALVVPVGLGCWLVFDARARSKKRRVFRSVLVSAAIGIGVLLVIDGVVTNPSGFRARLAFLTGSASQDFAHYSKDFHGRMLVLADVALHFPRYYPWPFAIVIALGVGRAIAWLRGSDGRRGVAALLPLLGALSFTVAFNCVARRTEHRFLLPQYAFVSLYAGLGLDVLWKLVRPGPRVPIAAVATCGLFAWGASGSMIVDANLLLDPRYDAERWLEEHVRPKSTIEVYGLNVYMPRLPDRAVPHRVGPEPADKRNPMPGFVEVVDRFDNIGARRPDFVVVSQGWVWRYLLDPNATPASGRVLPPTQIETGSDPDGTTFFPSLLGGKRGYRLAHVAAFDDSVWPRLDIHASVAREIWIYEREDSPASSSEGSEP